MKEDVIIVDIIGSVLTAVSTKLVMPINYVYGQDIQILQTLKEFDDDPVKGGKFPLFALYMPFPEIRGGAFYAEVTINRIAIACLTTSTDKVPKRYGETFKPKLYPVYYSFLEKLAASPYINQKNQDSLIHTKRDVPGLSPISGTSDYLDSIQIENLKLNISQRKTC